jgi:hypothetical protein
VGSWQPGASFALTFQLPRTLIDSGAALSVRLCMGAEKNCVFSPDIARAPSDAAVATVPARFVPLVRKPSRRTRRP